MADALYCCQAVVVTCQHYDWKYILTLKEGRQPTTWEETIRPAARSTEPTACAACSGKAAKKGGRIFAGSRTSCSASTRPTSFSRAKSPPRPAPTSTLISPISPTSPRNAWSPWSTSGGRERHLIEDTFNTQKNNGIGLEHVFCANATASKNYYTMMQVAQILWLLICRGCLQRLYDWARRATEQGLARAVWEGLRACRLPPDLPPLGQIRFSSA